MRCRLHGMELVITMLLLLTLHIRQQLLDTGLLGRQAVTQLVCLQAGLVALPSGGRNRQFQLILFALQSTNMCRALAHTGVHSTAVQPTDTGFKRSLQTSILIYSLIVERLDLVILLHHRFIFYLVLLIGFANRHDFFL